jgi:type IV pilus assembly protein PilM
MGFLNTKIINFDPEIFGIDLSDLSVKVMQIERSGGIDRIRSFFVADIPPGNIEDGKVINKDVVVKIIKEAVSKAGPKKIKTNKVICSLPESKVFLRVINLPKMEEAEAEEAVKWEMEANIPIPIDQAYYDWQFLDSSNGKQVEHAGKKQDVLTVAIAKEVVDDLVGVLEAANLDVYGMEVESIATARSLVARKKSSEKDDSSLIIDLGAQRTSFIVINVGVPTFTSSIPFSSDGISDAISKGFNVSLKEAEKMKISHGIEAINENPVFGVVRSLLENLVQETEKTLDFYSDFTKNGTKIEKIILCGGGANLKGLAPFLTKRLSKEIELGDSWINLNLGKKLPIIDRENSIRYSTVIGLALRGMNYEN